MLNSLNFIKLPIWFHTMLYQSNLFPEIEIYHKMTNSLFILEKETRSKIIKPLPGIKTKKKNLSFLWSHTLTSYWKHCQSALIKDNQYFQNDRRIDLMSKTLPFHLPHMYVYILVVTIPSKTYFSYKQYHWLFGEVFFCQQANQNGF